jgi:N-acyl-D-aspartate/D-glutamate deacylase
MRGSGRVDSIGRAARTPLLSAILVLVAAGPGGAEDRHDLVLRGGRVMDPETGLDAVRDVGISGDRITAVSAVPLPGARVLDVRGLVVAPGFIDLHSHGQDPENDRLKVQDGVTTALELELGVPDLRRFLDGRRGRALVHFGATASHPWARVAAFGGSAGPGELVPPSGAATNEPATAEQRARILERLAAELEAGGLGVGMGISYTPGATRLEVIEAFRLAAERRVPVFTHVRSAGRVEPGSSIEAVSEVIGAAAVTGASLHIVHINSSGLQDAPECLRLVEGARARGLDVTTEAYPYGAGMTAINSALFDAGWQERLGIGYGDLQRVETGERLTRESFERLHSSPRQELVLLFLNPRSIVDAVITHPLVAIASDGLVHEGKGHPRGAGTYARILGRYVRDEGRLTLMDALRKMSLMPAQRLERATAAARRKGRLQVGADADVVVFDPGEVRDRASYDDPSAPSAGFRFVIVSGTLVVEDGQLVEGMAPGAAFLGHGAPSARGGADAS